MTSSDIDNLVSELQLELDQLEKVFQSDCEIYNEQNSTSLRLAAFQEAERDGEKEELEDKLQLLLFQTEDFHKQMSSIQSNLLDITRKNEELEADNNMLQIEYKALEYKLAETKSKLARLQSVQDDYFITKDLLERELNIEKSKRLIAEKERDVYINAYESCLKHLEKFSRVKLLKK
eukprot:gene20148-26159_t